MNNNQRMATRNPWTVALVGAGIISLPGISVAEESPTSAVTLLPPTTLSGYVDTSAQWNLGTGNTSVPSYAFGGPSKADGFNLNVVKLSLENPPGEDGWATGYKVDLVAGPDANSLYAISSTAFSGPSDFGVKQAYVALRAPVGNGINFKAGLWDAPIGFEVFESINNPNFTRSYGYTIEPTTHTGVIAGYQLTDFLAASVGVANTLGPQINERAHNPSGPKAESYKAYMGTLTLTAPESMGFLAGSTISGTVINGFNSFSQLGAADQTSYYLGAVVNTPVKGLRLGASYDQAYVGEQDITGGLSSRAQAVALYALMQMTEKLSLHARGEYAEATTSLPFLAEKIYAVTGTVQYDLWKNVVSRLEFRWDHAADGSRPYDGKKESFIVLLNLVYRF